MTKKSCNVHNNLNGLSKEIKVYNKHNVSVQVFENSASQNCTKAVFEGSPQSMGESLHIFKQLLFVFLSVLKDFFFLHHLFQSDVALQIMWHSDATLGN